jgi:cyclophilin family peptidyl-prolyl cis-trans isomerase/HEAT repeat protein
MRALAFALLLATATAQTKTPRPQTVPLDVEIQILKAEDLREYDDLLAAKLDHAIPEVRERAALAAGRIGNPKAVPVLIDLAKADKSLAVRRMAVFALGETEAESATNGVLSLLEDKDSGVRARAFEALGKIAAALPEPKKEEKARIGKAITDVVQKEAEAGVIEKALTAILRARPAEGGKAATSLLSHTSASIRATSLNALARMQYKEAAPAALKLLGDTDPVVRANAARVLATAQDADSLAGLIKLAAGDDDSRVRVSSLRALTTRKQDASMRLMKQAQNLLTQAEEEMTGKASAPPPAEPEGEQTSGKPEPPRVLAKPPASVKLVKQRPTQLNELLTYATMFGQVATNQRKQVALAWLGQLRKLVNYTAPEVEIALARLDPSVTYAAASLETADLSWQSYAAIAQGLGEIPNLKPAPPAEVSKRASDVLSGWLESEKISVVAKPNILTAYAAFKPTDLETVALRLLKNSDVLIRANAAEILGEKPSDANTAVLIEALGVELAHPPDLNDSALAIIAALGKQKNSLANAAVQKALDSPDSLIQKAVTDALKASLPQEEARKLPAVKVTSIFTDNDYRRALQRSRSGRSVSAVINTERGSFTIKLDPKNAPLTVHSFLNLATGKYPNSKGKGFFNGIGFHRVVPNFVIQGGDPRGDGNGGPGYQIRCEINTSEYTRAAVGMALSGKDTGGSQWFVTHSPQPHLDGGYTIFGYVTGGMEVVDHIQRGDKILSVTIRE